MGKVTEGGLNNHVSLFESPHVVLRPLVVSESELCRSFTPYTNVYIHICIQHMLSPSYSCCITQRQSQTVLTCPVIVFPVKISVLGSLQAVLIIPVVSLTMIVKALANVCLAFMFTCLFF